MSLPDTDRSQESLPELSISRKLPAREEAGKEAQAGGERDSASAAHYAALFVDRCLKLQ